eukprot:15114691-Ditylum_brightwellii.AAC.1
MRVYSHEGFAVGVAYDGRPLQFLDTMGMFVNSVLFPFEGGKGGGKDTLKDVHQRWVEGVMPIADTPYDMVTAMGY